MSHSVIIDEKFSESPRISLVSNSMEIDLNYHDAIYHYSPCSVFLTLFRLGSAEEY